MFLPAARLSQFLRNEIRSFAPPDHSGFAISSKLSAFKMKALLSCISYWRGECQINIYFYNYLILNILLLYFNFKKVNKIIEKDLINSIIPSYFIAESNALICLCLSIFLRLFDEFVSLFLYYLKNR